MNILHSKQQQKLKLTIREIEQVVMEILSGLAYTAP